MTDIKTVAIIGASGNIGTAILSALQKTNLKITIITRPDSNSKFDSSIPVIKVDYNLPSLTKAFQNQDAILSCVKISAVPLEKIFIDAAVAAGVKWFFPSEYGHPLSKEVLELSPTSGVKVESIEYLRKMEGRGLRWVGVTTGLFLDWGLTYAFLDINLKSLTTNLWDNGTIPFTVTNTTTIGKAIATLLTNSSARETAKNKSIHISTATTTQSELLKFARKYTTDGHGEKWTMNQVDGAQLVVDAQKGLVSGNAIIQGIALTKGLSSFGDEAAKWNSLLGLEDGESVEETVMRVVGEVNGKI
ncbi:NAD(P)-binding protein [Tothia fuscella]|uniref:NAD(P)-binding protein n=1 Tax=Tothia fuscella TaxID=1048955 RepID=A0A9P4P477_9PEZI|nr:NAD(P)-binding protein [Tothia fuscella]